MFPDEIHAWLKNPDYESGITLFIRYCDDSNKVWFAQQRAWKLKRLITELTALSKINLTARMPVSKKKAPDIVIKPEKTEKLPVHILEIKKQADKAWKEARDLHSMLLSVRSKRKRFLMSKRILELRPIAMNGWDVVKRYQATGDLSFLTNTVTEQDKLKDVSLEDLINKIRNIPGYITKFKKKLANTKSKEKNDYLIRMIAERETELKAVYERIHFLNDKIVELCL